MFFFQFEKYFPSIRYYIEIYFKFAETIVKIITFKSPLLFRRKKYLYYRLNIHDPVIARIIDGKCTKKKRKKRFESQKNSVTIVA